MQCPLASESQLSCNVEGLLAGRFRTHKWPLTTPFGQRAPRREFLARSETPQALQSIIGGTIQSQHVSQSWVSFCSPLSFEGLLNHLTHLYTVT